MHKILAAYLFVDLNDLEALKEALHAKCINLKLQGTILLAKEGINISLCGGQEEINYFCAYLRLDTRFALIKFKISNSEIAAFRRLLVKIKPEIITMNLPLNGDILNFDSISGSKITPITLKSWLDKGCDDQGKEILLVDIRNQFEIEYGTFINAASLGLRQFSEFSKNTIQQKLHQKALNKTIVSFCTGGIRCEKSTLYIQQTTSLKNIYQLDGGILNYFTKVGNDHYKGGCFVFDARVVINP